jgi:cyclopropane fatty-acyl-phospholipid synthase-like methyltransferase
MNKIKTLVIGRGNIIRSGYLEITNSLNDNIIPTTLDIQQESNPDICSDFIDYLANINIFNLFDQIIIDIFTFSNLHNIDLYLEKIYNLLTPNGKFIFQNDYLITYSNILKPNFKMTNINIPRDYNKYNIQNDYIKYISNLTKNIFEVKYYTRTEYPLFQNKYITNYFELSKINLSGS